MIEPTDEMLNVYERAADVALGHRTQGSIAGLAAVLAIVERDYRRRIAEEIACAIEVAEGVRCPDCGGKAASAKWKGMTRLGRCGGGHTWEVRSRDWHSPAAIARRHAEADHA